MTVGLNAFADRASNGTYRLSRINVDEKKDRCDIFIVSKSVLRLRRLLMIEHFLSNTSTNIYLVI